MRRRFLRATAWDAAPQQLLELVLWIGLMGVVIFACLPLMQRLTDSARLVEPLHTARDLSYRMAIDHAFSGRWRAPANFDLPGSVSSLTVLAEGDIQLHLAAGFTSGEVKSIHWQHFARTGSYGFLAWHCGGKASALQEAPLRYTLSPTQRDITRYICQ